MSLCPLSNSGILFHCVHVGDLAVRTNENCIHFRHTDFNLRRMSDILNIIRRVLTIDPNLHQTALVFIYFWLIWLCFVSVMWLYPDAQEESFKYLVRTNNRSELVWKLYFILVVGGFPASTMSMAATSVLICRVFIGGFDTKYIFHPYEMMWVALCYVL